MTSKTKFNKWKALGEKNLADLLTKEPPGVAGVARGFFYDVWLPLARRKGLAHAVALNATGGLNAEAVEYVRKCRPIGGARALIDDVWRCSMPATEDEFHSEANRAIENQTVAVTAHKMTRLMQGACGFHTAFTAWVGSKCVVPGSLFAHEVGKALGTPDEPYGTLRVHGARIAEILGLPEAFGTVLDDHSVHVVLSGYSEPVLGAEHDYKKGAAYSDSPAKAAACVALVKQYNVGDYTLVKAVLDRLPWMK